MIPRMNLRTRIIAWLLWRLEGFDSFGTAELCILRNPGMLNCASILRDYYYVKKSEVSAE